MDKLELKDIAPYLPFKVKVQITDGYYDGKFKILSGVQYDGLLNLGKGGRFGFIEREYHQVKLLLRPMSDLTKEITHNGETFIPIARLLRMKFPDEPLIGRYSIIKVSKSGYPRAYFEFMATKEIRIYPFELFNTPYWIIQKLQEWQFDTEKLIERGLAIDLNEVDNGK
ncbi:hypothetical protein HZP50_07050 [Elizabethkingia anophelis]|nr:hypothetical protein [Elizabethkingia anophelis]